MIIKGTLDKSDPAHPTVVWQEPAVDVGAPAGLQNIVFSTVVAGDPDRAAFAFHGTTTEGDSGDMATFPSDAEWYLYVAATFDGGRTWNLRNATPNDPTQKGSICDKGTTCDNTPDDRNLLDFMDADIDGQGRVIVGLRGRLRGRLRDGRPEHLQQARIPRTPGLGPADVRARSIPPPPA